jgi:hypothetical protein
MRQDIDLSFWRKWVLCNGSIVSLCSYCTLRIYPTPQPQTAMSHDVHWTPMSYVAHHCSVSATPHLSRQCISRAVFASIIIGRNQVSAKRGHIRSQIISDVTAPTFLHLYIYTCQVNNRVHCQCRCSRSNIPQVSVF